MKLGGKCPLNNMKNKEEFLIKELENFYNKPVNFDIEKMKDEFCRNICKNIMC
jgi:hypothetical protein